MKPQHRTTYLQKRAIVMDPEEKTATALIQSMRALRKEQTARRKEKQEQRRARHRKAVQETEEEVAQKKKAAKKEHLQGVGKKRQAEVVDEDQSNKRARSSHVS